MGAGVNTYTAALALCLVASLGACGDGTASLSVSMSLDEATCGADTSNLIINCPGTIWIGVERFDGTPIASDCLQVQGNGTTLATIPQLLSEGLDLGTLPADTPLRISMQISSRPFAACPESAPEELPVVGGSTDFVLLSEQGERVVLPLSCFGSPAAPIDGCEQCEQSLGFCLSNADAHTCASIQERCRSFCSLEGAEDPTCLSSCETWPLHCEDSALGPAISCDSPDSEQLCLEQCQDFPEPEVCLNECLMAPPNCFEIQSEVQRCQNSAAACYQTCEDVTPDMCLLVN